MGWQGTLTADHSEPLTVRWVQSREELSRCSVKKKKKKKPMTINHSKGNEKNPLLHRTSQPNKQLNQSIKKSAFALFLKHL